MRKIKVKCPATIANLVCGFDILGMAVDAPNDIIEAELLDDPVIQLKHTDEYGLSENPAENVCGVSVAALLEAYQKPVGIKLTITKNIKPGSGLGSSAASAAGAVVAANILLDNYFSNEQLVQFAMFGEKLASGVKHADNIAPCIYGGITLIRSIHPLDIISIPSVDLFVSIVHPQIEVRTADARQILRHEILLKDAIKQWGNIAGLVAGLINKDASLIGRSLEDVIIEPARSILIPCFDEIKAKCMAAGALGGGISGSGPSLFMLSEKKETAEQISRIMQSVYQSIQLNANTYITKISSQGVVEIF